MRKYLEDLLKLNQYTNAIVNQKIMALVVGSRSTIRIKVAGINYQLHTSGVPHHFTGVGYFSIDSRERATFIRAASYGESQTYLEIFPLVRMILLAGDRDYWYGIQSQASQRISIAGTSKIVCVEEGLQMFDIVQCAFDGTNLIFTRADFNVRPQIAQYLRDQAGIAVESKQLRFIGLTPQHVQAYDEIMWARFERERQAELARLEEERQSERGRIEYALSFSGAALREYVRHGDVYVITYEVDGSSFTSTIRADNLQVESAGVCLAGTDRQFDLTSVVGVLRVGIQQSAITRGDYSNYERGDDDYD